MNRILHSSLIASIVALLSSIHAQDTFSIVAADSTTREVGSAGASCVDLFQAGLSDPSFLGDLLPDTGAINTQAYYIPANQNAARARMRDGLSPEQIIDWLATNDVGDNPSLRQYGIAGFSGGNVSSAGYTGANTDNYKAHRTGSIDGIHYSIQGNILLGQQIIDSMEARFRAEPGNLACRLMAALQGAKVVGADTRCAPNETSTLFAFVKVAQPGDTYGQPTFKLGVRTRNNQRIEPIDSLQVLFDAVEGCMATGEALPVKPAVRLYPNPTDGKVYVELPDQAYPRLLVEFFDSQGKHLLRQVLDKPVNAIDLGHRAGGLCVYRITQADRTVQAGTLVVN